MLTGEAFLDTHAMSCCSGRSVTYEMRGVWHFQICPLASTRAQPLDAASFRPAVMMSSDQWNSCAERMVQKSGWTLNSGEGMNAMQCHACDVACILTSDWILPRVWKMGCISRPLISDACDPVKNSLYSCSAPRITLWGHMSCSSQILD